MSGPLALIAALDRQHAIGRGNTLPWHLPEDLRRFKRLTLGRPVLMGRKTAESIGRALPGRRNLVLTRGDRAPFAEQIAVPSIARAREMVGEQMLFVIGGAEVYALTLPDATHLHLTWVDTEVGDADAWFPPFNPDAWRILADEPHAADARHAHAYRFTDYQRL